ncbi:ion channel [Marinagarivorans algicola]|uniref:ion channel n=1 Tax=Marinagarivorans algicola TaxID=1513270 RepID=UPI0006B8D821|nr:ion channel [Marinagarivorans algicola]
MFVGIGVSQETHEFKFGLLLACLFGAILIPPYFEGQALFDVAWKVVFSLVLLAAMYSVTGRHTYLIPSAFLLVPTVSTVWFDHFSVDNHTAFYLDNITSIAFLGFICFHLLRHILNAKTVTTNVIYASMCVYLMLGLIWAAIYANIHLFYGEAFVSMSGLDMNSIASYKVMGFFTYYSMITMSTLGYGDIVPVNKVAQAWASVQAMVGQFYIAVIMARLVSLHARDSTDT